MTALQRVRAALSAGERPADADVREVCADVDALIAALRLELLQPWNEQGAPDHCHLTPCKWDDDAGNRSVGRAGEPCLECAIWDRARAAIDAVIREPK